jgi:cell wall-associated NlpC family hydrolase
MDNRNYKHLIGIPYEEKHCWDLATFFYSSVMGIEISHVFSGPHPGDKEKVAMLIQSNKGKFQEVKVAQFGDLVIIKLFGIENHIAVYLGNGYILHTTKRIGSHIAPLKLWRNTIVGYYRVING